MLYEGSTLFVKYRWLSLDATQYIKFMIPNTFLVFVEV